MVSQSNTEIKVDNSVGCLILKSDDVGLLFTYFKIEKKRRGAIEKYYKIILEQVFLTPATDWQCCILSKTQRKGLFGLHSNLFSECRKLKGACTM